MRQGICCRLSSGRRTNRTSTSSLAQWVCRGRRSPEALRRATCSARPTKTTRNITATSNRRHFVLPSGLVKIIGKPLMFSLSNGWAKFYQVDHHRKHEEKKGEF